MTAATRVWEAAKAATALRARLGRSGTCPPGLAEAAAALQDLALRLAPTAEAAARRAELHELQAGLPLAIQIMQNGPYLVTNARRLADHLGIAHVTAPQLALCRCGASAIKPLCDGSHARIGFTDAKDPKRVPDRRDTYAGQQVTIFDNRGICQHSGLCTDRLAAVFRTNTEPFVAPSGGRLDEIIRAVRDCAAGDAGTLGQDEAALPGPGQPVSFADHIKPLFRERDRQSMSFAFDLWSCDDVRARAADILARLRNGTMPCDGAWPTAKVEVFSRWVDSGTPP